MKDVELFEKERASNYDDFIPVWMPQYRFVIDALPDILHGLNQLENRQLLVAGCGTGNEMLAFLKSSVDWFVTGVDPSPDMISLAKEKLEGYLRMNLVCGQVGDLSSSPTYGAATLILVLHFLKDDGAKLALLKDIASRLLPGAPFALVDVFGDTTEIRQNLIVLKSLLEGKVEAEEMGKKLKIIENNILYVPEYRLTELLEEAGFEKPVRFFQAAIYGGWTTRKK